MKKNMLMSLFMAGVLLAPVQARAASDEDVAAMAMRIQVLEQALQELKAQQQAIAQEQARRETTQAVPPVNFAGMEPAAGGEDIDVSLGSKGLEIKNADDDTLLRVRGYLQADHRAFLDDSDNDGDDEFEIRRSRLIVEGEIDDFYYRLSPDFGGLETRLYDGYVGYSPAEAFDLRIGKFKPSVGLERLKSSTDTTFVEFAMPTLLTPNRDIGMQLSGQILNRKLSYQLGVFNGAEDDALLTGDNDDNKELAGRLFAEPVKGIGLGVSGTWGEREGEAGESLLPSYRTPGRLRFFQYDGNTFVDGNVWRVVPQAYVYRGPFSFMGEYALSAHEVRNGSATDNLENKAWGVQWGWVLTGEDATYKSVSPARPFDPAQGGWGAWEIAARYGVLDIDNDAFPVFASAAASASEALNWGFALNGYLNDHVRLQLDYENTNFDAGAAAGTDRETEQVILSRVGFKF